MSSELPLSDNPAPPVSLDRETRTSLRRDLALFGVFALLGVVASYISVQIPHTEAFFEIRWTFGLMGAALIRRLWLVAILVSLLAVVGFHGDLPLITCYLGNMLYAVPGAALTRLTYDHLLGRLRNPALVAAGWFVLMMVVYQAFNTPMVWGVLFALEDKPFVDGTIEGWRTQPFIIESLIVATISSIGMAAFTIYGQLQASEARFRLLSEATSVGLVVHRGGRLLEANQAFYDLFGYRPEDLRRPGVDVVEAVIAPESRAEVRSMIASDRTAYEAEGMRHDGSRVPIEVTASTIRYDGAPARAAAITDVSDRRRMEDRLRQSQKLEAIGQLAGGVAHDFNNQLAGIAGFGELLHNRLSDPKLAGYAEGILTCARRAGDLTRQLLAFSRRGLYRTESVDLHETIDEVTAILERSIDRSISIVRRYEASPPVTPGDPTLLQNMLLNLGLNARDAMPDGGELIFATEIVELDADYCAATPHDIEPGRFVCVSVTDTGQGMTDEVKARIFEPFFTTKEPGKGTGMGMAAVYGAVKQHGGSINVYSEPGRGTTFRVYLPETPGQREKPHTSAPAEPVAADRPARILVVDDEELLRVVAMDILAEAGYTVLSQPDGERAVAYFREHWEEIDLVLLDMIMPQLGGRQACEAMLEIDPGARIVLCSGYSLNGEAQLLLDRGVVDFVQKPYRRSELTRKVAEALKGSAQPNGSNNEAGDG